jgi:uncharacterized protein YkwD
MPGGVTLHRWTARRLSVAAVSIIASCTLTARPAQAAQADRCRGSLNVPTSADELDQAADAIVCLVNAERTSRDLRPLRRDGDLAQAARRHAVDMVRRNYFSHVSPGGTSPGDRAVDAGYASMNQSWKVGEDLGWGTGTRATPNTLVDEWMASPPHRRILLEAGYRELGVGVASGAPVDHATALPGATYALELGVIR